MHGLNRRRAYALSRKQASKSRKETEVTQRPLVKKSNESIKGSKAAKDTLVHRTNVPNVRFRQLYLGT